MRKPVVAITASAGVSLLVLVIARAIAGNATITPVSLGDLNPGPGHSAPGTFTQVDDYALFAATTTGNFSHRTLWRTNGTPGGTFELTDPGNVIDIAALGSVGIFSAGGQIWSTSGTAGTTGPISPVVFSSDPTNLTPDTNVLFFTASDASNGREIWKTDGTAMGTVRVTDVNPGAGDALPYSLTSDGSVLYFGASDGTNSFNGLFKTNGTPGNLETLVANVGPYGLALGPGGALYFGASDGTNGTELWKSDGTPGGTAILKNIQPGLTSSFPFSMTPAGDLLFFTATDPTAGTELWKSDGTPEGTTVVKDIVSGTGGSNPSDLTALGSLIFFSASDGTNARWWRSDGTDAGTFTLGPVTLHDPTSFLAVSEPTMGYEFMHVVAIDGSNPPRLWRSDGTTMGTEPVTETAVRPASRSPGGTAMDAGLPPNAPDDSRSYGADPMPRQTPTPLPERGPSPTPTPDPVLSMQWEVEYRLGRFIGLLGRVEFVASGEEPHRVDLFGSLSSPSGIGLVDPAGPTVYLTSNHANGPAQIAFSYGSFDSNADRIITGNWDDVIFPRPARGISTAAETVGLYDAEAGAFFLRNTHSSGPADETFFFGPGGAGWIPIAGDWDGTGPDTVGVYDPVNGAFFLRNAHANGPADETFFFGPGNAGWIPIAGDWDGDGTDTVGVYDPVNGAFFLRNAHANGPADETFFYGPANAGWIPIAGDWDGNGTDTVGLYDPVNGAIFLRNTHANGPADTTFFFGPANAGWQPLAGIW